MSRIGHIGRMHWWVPALAVALPALAAGQDLDALNRAISDLSSGHARAAVATLYPIAESPESPLKLKAQFYLGQALDKAGFPGAAMLSYVDVLRAGPNHPFRLEAIDGLVQVQRELKDPFLIPTALAEAYDPSWSALSAENLARVHELVALTQYRGLKLEAARDLLLSIPPETSVWAKARYLLGVIYSDPRYPGGAQNAQARAMFSEAMTANAHQDGREDIRTLAQLGVARMDYAAERYAEASSGYDRIPRFSKYWDQALFEGAFARFRNADYGGALGSLQALHAPQFEGSFQPESWLLKATVYHFSCLYDESKASLKTFEQIYVPMADQLEPLLKQEDGDDSRFAALALSPSAHVPRPIYLWVRRNDRIRGVLDVIAELDREASQIASAPEWRDQLLASQLPSDLQQNRATLEQAVGKLVKNRLVEAYQNVRKARSDADLIVFQTTLAQKRLFELGVDQKKLLADQKLFRPLMPSEEWNYWQFQGEFWLDEIGYYQYTLKRGCPELE